MHFYKHFVHGCTLYLVTSEYKLSKICTQVQNGLDLMAQGSSRVLVIKKISKGHTHAQNTCDLSEPVNNSKGKIK